MPEQNQQAVPLSEEDTERAAALFKEISSKTEELSLIVARTLGFEHKAAVEGRLTFSSSVNTGDIIVPHPLSGGWDTECYTFSNGECGCYAYSIGYCFPC